MYKTSREKELEQVLKEIDICVDRLFIRPNTPNLQDLVYFLGLIKAKINGIKDEN